MRKLIYTELILSLRRNYNALRNITRRSFTNLKPELRLRTARAVFPVLQKQKWHLEIDSKCHICINQKILILYLPALSVASAYKLIGFFKVCNSHVFAIPKEFLTSKKLHSSFTVVFSEQITSDSQVTH
jgi:hypothetical protein